MSSNLQLFWQLASASEEERLSSSDKLVTDLLAQQEALASSSKAPIESAQEEQDNEDDEQHDDDASKQNGTEQTLDALSVSDRQAKAAEDSVAARNAADLTYALRRLIRGLASPRENSRLGFAVALTELLSNLESVTSNEILVLILKYSATQGSMSGQEQRDLMFAKLFGVLALIQSRLLFRDTSSLDHFKRAIQVIFALFSAKTWMSESCGWVIAQTVDHLNRADGAPTWSNDALQWIAERTCASKDLTPEKFAVIFKLAQTGSVQNLESLIVPPFKNAQLLSSANLPILARILKDSSPSDTQEGSTGSRSSFRPQLHFVWDVILDAYFAENTDDILGKAAPFPQFFKVIVDESLFSASASTERKSWGFQVFGRSIARARNEDKPLLFTPNFMRTWINQLSKEDRFLHMASLKAAEAVQDAVKSNPQLGFVLLSQLIGEHGNQNFDRITKTKTVEGILSSLDVQGVKDYLKHLRDLVCMSEDSNEGEDDAKAKSGQRAWAFDQMLSLVRNTAIPKDDTLISDILEFFIAHGYFIVKQAIKKNTVLNKLPEPALTDEAKQQCRSRLVSCLSELSGQTTVLSDSDGKTRKAPGVTSTGVLWLQKAHEIMVRFGKDKNFTTIFDNDDEIEATIKAGNVCLTKIRKQEETTGDVALKEQLRAFQSLLLAGLIVSVDSEDGAADLVEPLCACADKLWPASKGKSKKAAAKANDEDGEEVDASVVLVDCLVNFLELPSVLLRTVADQAFEAFSRDMTAEGLDHLLVQLGQTETAAMDVDEDEEEEEAEAAEGAEELSDTSVTSDDDEDEAKSEDEEEDDDDEEGEVDAELRAKVEEALRDSGLADPEDDENGDENDEDDDDDSRSDASSELLDDDQMMLLDDKLGEIFRQTRSAKSGRKEAKKEENVLKNKLLDLIEIFARKESGNKLVLRLVSPLFGLARDEDSDDSQLSKRAANILRARLCKGKDTPEGITMSEVIEDLEQVHRAARSSTQAELANLVGALNLYLTKVALSGRSAPSSSTEDLALVKLYKETLNDFLTRKKSNVKPAFLIDAFRRFPLLGWTMREDLLDSCRPRAAAHAFRQLQAMQMLQAMMTQLAQLAEKEQIVEFIPDINKCICEIVSSAATDADSPFNANRLKESIKFVLQVARLSKRVVSSSDKLRTTWKLNKLHDAADQLQSSERFKASTSIHALFKQLFAILEPSAGEKTPKAHGGVEKAKAAATEQTPTKTAKVGKKRSAADTDSTSKKSTSKNGSPKKAKTKSA